jgi:8-oxo-dGTP pyrophosphatase MutT (NUDIX family)
MYKIYINGTPLFLTSTQDFKELQLKGENFIKARYVGKKKVLHNYIDLLEKNTAFDAVVLHFNDVKRLWKDFKAIYKIMKAAGGVVENEKNEVLMIYRRDHWDLPKGKIEKKESKEDAAVREVMEETGLQNVDLQDFIHTSYHTYIDRKDRRVLKVTYWFTMKTTDTQLIPQAEEDIEEAVFVDLKNFFSESKPIYGNILDTIEVFNKNQNKD